MSKAELISIVIAGVFNITAIIVKALGFGEVADMLYEVMPYVDSIVLALLALFGYQRYRAMRNMAGNLYD